MTFKNWKLFGDKFIVLVVLLSYHHVTGQAPAQRPIANGPPKSGPGNINGEIVVEIQTPPTTPSNINSIVNAKPAGINRPISPTPKPSVPPRPPAKLPGNGATPVINVMSIKTGFLTAANDPCSYVSCIRADSYLHCAIVKCDPGQAFSQASFRCLPSPQCAAKLPGSIQQKPGAQKLPQLPPKPPQTRPW